MDLWPTIGAAFLLPVDLLAIWAGFSRPRPCPPQVLYMHLLEIILFRAQHCVSAWALGELRLVQDSI